MKFSFISDKYNKESRSVKGKNFSCLFQLVIMIYRKKGFKGSNEKNQFLVPGSQFLVKQ
jgi:hypothetical protein